MCECVCVCVCVCVCAVCVRVLTRLKLSQVVMSSSMLYCSSTTTLAKAGLSRRAQSSQCTTYVFLLLLSLVTNSRSKTSHPDHTWGPKKGKQASINRKVFLCVLMSLKYSHRSGMKYSWGTLQLHQK